MPSPRRFPPLWTIEDIGAAFVVKEGGWAGEDAIIASCDSRSLEPDPMLALSDNQLAAIIAAANRLPVEKRGTFLDRVVARLSQHGTRFTGADFDAAVRLALTSLMERPAA